MIKIIKHLKEKNISNEKYWFLQIKLPQLKPLLDYYQNLIPSTNLYNNVDNEFGYEFDPHITLLYGILPPPTGDKGLSIPCLCKLIFENLKSFDIQLTNITKFNNKPEYDVIKIDVQSPRLFEIHDCCVNNFVNNQTYNDYKPHITIAYVKPDSTDYLLDRHINKALTINNIILTSPEKIDHTIYCI